MSGFNTGGSITANDQFGTLVKYLGNIDGNSSTVEFMVTAVLDEVGTTGTGAVYIISYNPLTQLVVSNWKIAPGSTGFTEPNIVSNENFGYDIEYLGDVDGNAATVEMLIGAYRDEAVESTNSGEGVVYYISYNLTTSTVVYSSRITSGLSGFPSSVLSTSDNFGASIKNLGNIDSDSSTLEILVGAVNNSITSFGSEGALYLLHFNPTTKMVTSYSKFDLGLNSQLSEYFGASISSIHEIDNNPDTVDILVGSWGLNGSVNNVGGYRLVTYSKSTQSFSYGSAITTGVSNFTEATLDNNDSFGQSISIFDDLDNDPSTVDLVVGAVNDEPEIGGGTFKGAFYIQSVKFPKYETSGTFSTPISVDSNHGNLISWDKLLLNQDIPTGTKISYTVFNGGYSVASGCTGTAFSNLTNIVTSDGYIDISSIPTSNTSLCLKATLYSDSTSNKTPILNSWRATYITDKNPSFNFNVIVDESSLTGNTIDNLANISTTTPETNYSNNSDTYSLLITNDDLYITKDVNKSAILATEINGNTSPQNQITYTLNYGNNGPSDGVNSFIKDLLPNADRVVSVTGISDSNNLFTCQFTDIDNLDSDNNPSTGKDGLYCDNDGLSSTTSSINLKVNIKGNITFVVTYNNAVGTFVNNDVLTNNVLIDSDTFDINKSNNDDSISTVVGSFANIYVDKSGPNYANINGDITYNIKYGNNGNLVANNFSLTDTLDTNIASLVSITQVSGTSLTCTPNTGDPSTFTPTFKFSCGGTGMNLNVNQTGEIQVKVKVKNDTNLVINKEIINNSVIVATTSTETNVTDNYDEHDVPIIDGELISLSGHVFLDRDSDVLFDNATTPSDTYINNVTVLLHGSDELGNILGPDKSLYPSAYQLLTGNNPSNPYPTNYIVINEQITGQNGNSDGFYSFAGLHPGTYQIYEIHPLGYISTGSTAGIINLNTDGTLNYTSQKGTGSKEGGSSKDRITNVILANGEHSIFNDFGELLGEIGNYVWEDMGINGVGTGNGIFDTGEKFITGVEVSLFEDKNHNGLVDVTDPVRGITQTDNTGYYLFSNLNLDDGDNTTLGFDYIVKVTEFTDTTSTTPNVLKNYSQTSTIFNNTNTTDQVARESSGYSVTISTTTPTYYKADFGFIYGQIGDLLFEDKNGNKKYDTGDVVLKDVKVKLFDNSNNPIKDLSGNNYEVTTDANGLYLFDKLSLDDGSGLFKYKVVVDNSSVIAINTKYINLSQNTTTNSDSKNANGYLVDLDNITGKYINLTADFGYIIPVSLGDFVWHDEDRDGIQDSTETGIVGAVVKLTDSSGNSVNDASGNTVNDITTPSSGAYLFTNLIPGDYIVTFTPPTNYKLTLKDQGTDDAKDSDADTTNGKTTTITLVSGVDQLTWDAGVFLPKASMGDYVWYDSNKNGVQDTGEIGIKDIKVELLDAVSKSILNTVNTDSNGKYLFDNLIINKSYDIKFTFDSKYIETTKDIGNDSNDSDGSNILGVSVPNENSNLTFDLGLFEKPNVTINACDTYGNGKIDSNETTLPGTKITVYDKDGNELYSTVVGDSCEIIVTNIPPQLTEICVKYELPSGYYFASTGSSMINCNKSVLSGNTQINIPQYAKVDLPKTGVDNWIMWIFNLK